MYTLNIGFLLFLLILNNLVHPKKLEEIFTCTNETECVDLTEKVTSEETLSTTVENIYDTTSIFENNSTLSTQSRKIQILSTTEASHMIKYENEVQNKNVQRIFSDICECDLTVPSCDINCCCDKDCTDFHISVFSHCEKNEAELFDKRYCYNQNFIQRNNTPFILEKLANNLFCILYDNLPPTYSTIVNLDIKTEKDLREAINPNRLTWKWKDQLHVPEYNFSSLYQDNDIVWMVHKNNIQPFEILQSGFSDLCSFKKTVKYLREWKNQCLQTELNNTNKYLFPTKFNNTIIIASLPLLNETFTNFLDQVCPRNICITSTNYYCKHSWEVCSEDAVSGSCVNGTCYNIVKGIRFVIMHNGSRGINSFDIYFNIGNVSKSFYQQFEVTYKWTEYDKEKIFSLSGNPGYIIGKPIIIGTLKMNNINNVETKYIDINETNQFLTLPIATRSGDCSEIDRYTIAFGEDVKLKCSIHLNTINFTTESCVGLQNRTMQLLLRNTLFNITQTDQYNIYVSKAGNFSRNNTDDWVQILLDRVPQNIIMGDIVNGRLRCSGLIASIHLNILHSSLAKPESLINHNILGVSITFSTKDSLKTWPKCTTENCTDVLKLHVISYVTFHDISKPSKYFFAGGPNLDLTLPYDFFYPFLGSSTNIKSNILLIIVGLSIAFHTFIDFL